MMKKALYLLGEFSDQDIDWLIEVGQQRSLAPGQVLIHQDSSIEDIFIILQGQFRVSVESGEEIAVIGNGEIVGELSFLDSRPTQATVTAIEDSIVMAVEKSRIDGRLKTDGRFASRFYRALGILLADRLRDSVSQLAYGSLKENTAGEDGRTLSPELLDQLDLSAIRFERIRQRLLD
ncbi:MAG: cyclic nucleotide-binding protein [Acidiferrobacteraceae bacterium]|jgi:CRP-like cAMP-binding protein|nr:cyclic nucleotide-binding protein [Nitrospinota bacterium]MBT58533.1 cyclic nucleotide-binding protein [Acidiferrobacteraceae bacterium]|tara:strand:+ start:587 stop:1120 length:534 start_codon:yes stop_codon:yes gene_type:complete